MPKFKILRKLMEEAKAIKPIVSQGENLIREGNLASGQKIVQKLPTAEEYANKMSSLKKAAGVTGAIGASSLISQEDANAAGVQQLMKILNVTEDVARDVKKMAASVPPDVFEQNIKSIQDVTKYHKNPLVYPKLGKGMDYKVLDIGNNKVLKVPLRGMEETIENLVSPSLLENVNLGPKTKSIQAGDRTFMIQDKIRPINDIIDKTRRPGQDPIIENLYKERDKLWSKVDIDDKKAMEQIQQNPELKKIEDDIMVREHQILKEQGIDVNELVKEYDTLPFKDANRSPLLYPEETLEDIAAHKSIKELSEVINPKDTHSANIGLDSNNQLKILDSSRFDNLKLDKLTPEMKKKVIENYIALPNKKNQLVQSLNNVDTLKKAAAVTPLALTPTSSPEGLLNQGVDNLKMAYNKIRKPILETTRTLGQNISDVVRIPGMLNEEQIQQERDVAGTISEMALDPVNLLSPGLGAAVGAADLMMSPDEIDKNEKLKAIERMKK